MYHYITLWDSKIFMTWVGIIAFLGFFLFTIFLQSKKYKLQMKAFLRYFPFYLIGTYFLSTYLRYLFKEFVIIPLSWDQLLLYISPFWYTFHFIGIALWMILSWWHFLYSMKDSSYEIKQQRRQTLFHALTIACIPLWIFLLLGDNFIWQSTDWYFYVSAIREDSNVAVYGKVIPLWTILSLGWLLFHLISNRLNKHSQKDYTYFSLWLFCLFLGVLLLFQQYPRQLVTRVWSFVFDIKQYFLLIIMCIFMIKHYRINKPTVSSDAKWLDSNRSVDW